MRYDKGHKDASRRRILDVASRRFRRDGISAVGIASLMADAGLTHGGFYSHFGSKEDLVQEALADALEQTGTTLARAADEGGLAAIIHSYLRASHRDNPEQGCAIACVAAEMARQPVEARAALTRGLETILEAIGRHLPGPDAETRRNHALAIFSIMVGALQLARMVPDPALSERILQNGAAAALALAQDPA